MRTTIDLPDSVFSRLKAMAALGGSSLKQVILRAVEKELHAAPPKRRKARFPLIRSKEPGVLSLTSAEIEKLLLR